jgi:hypothetical protein
LTDVVEFVSDTSAMRTPRVGVDAAENSNVVKNSRNNVPEKLYFNSNIKSFKILYFEG